MDTSIEQPRDGRTYSATRRIRLADMDERGRLRLDALARLLQDTAIDDVAETGWGAPEHLWFVRRIRVDVRVPFLRDRSVGLVTWCSGVAALAAGRRWSVRGDAGGHAEVDSIWIHLSGDARPARIEDFGVYAEATKGRRVSTRLVLPDPPEEAPRAPWRLRRSDVDLHGHVNNAVHWQVVEDVLLAGGAVDPTHALRAELDYHDPIDLGDELEVATFDHDGPALALLVGDDVRAVARVTGLAG